MTFVIPIPATESLERPSVLASLSLQDSSDWEAVVVGVRPNRFLGAQSERTTEIVLPIGEPLSQAMNRGLEVARGRFVAFLAPGDVLSPNSVSSLAAVLDDDVDVDVVYSDEVRDGREFSKPVFSPERLRCQFYLGNLTVYRRTVLVGLGGVRSGIEGAESYDLALRVTRATGQVVHVAKTLLVGDGPDLARQWGTTQETALESTRTILEEHLEASGGGAVEAVDPSGIHRTHRQVKGQPLISIVIPTRGSTADVRGRERCMITEAVRGVIERSTYANIEFVIVIDSIASGAVRAELSRLGGDALRLVEWTRPFSFPEKVNLGVLHARGEFVILLNDDTEVITPEWIESMLALAQLPQAGLVGSMLYFENDTIQHAGHCYRKGDVTHIGLHSEHGAAGPFGGFLLEREVAGVTGACAMVRKSVFLEAGGLSTLLPGNFNDVDLCLKVATLGYQNYWTPFAELYHFESKSRNPRVGKSEMAIAWGRWEHLFWESPFWPTDPHEVYRLESGSHLSAARPVVDSARRGKTRETGSS